MKSRVGVGIIGFGTVGTGVARILLDNAGLIRRRVGVPVELIRIADLDVTRDRGLPIPANLLTQDSRQVLDDPAVDIVVELIGGYESAKRLILEAIAKGKQVVTANKALLAVHGEELYQAAARQKVDLAFEASVGGGIPIIRALTEGLAANRILSIYGIINGTSNYILTRMTQEGRAFEEVLEEAAEVAVHRLEGLHQPLAPFAIEVLDALAQASDGRLQVVTLGAHAVEPRFQLLRLLLGAEIDGPEPLTLRLELVEPVLGRRCGGKRGIHRET